MGINRDLQLWLQIVLIFTQVYNLYGSNSTINVSVTETSIRLEWPPLDLNYTFLLKYGVASNATDVTELPVTMPADNNTAIVETISGLYPGQQYTIQVDRDDMNVFADNITTKPLTVESLTVTSVSATSATFSWLPSNASIQDAYQVLVIGATNHSVTAQHPDTWLRVTGMQQSSVYTATMVTLSNGEMSNTSQVISMNTAPLPPEEVNVVAIDTTSLNVTWKPNSQSAQDGYMVRYIYNDTGVDNQVSGNLTCATSDDLYCVMNLQGVPGQVYDISVYSKLGDAVSEPMGMLHSTVPLPVTDLTEALSNTTSIHLHWTIPDNFLFRHYVIHVTSKYGEMTQQVSADELEYPITGLNTGSMYNISIVTSTGYEISPAVTKTFYTYPAQVDSLTSDVKSEIFNNSITVHWSINDNATYDVFMIDISPSPAYWASALSLLPDMTSYLFSDLTPGLAYEVSIATKLADKQSIATTNTFRTYPNIPEDPRLFNMTGTEITVSWNKPTGLVDSYTLLLIDENNQQTTLTLNVTTYTLFDLHPGTRYTLKLQSKSGEMYSAAINWSFTTNPGAVENLRATLKDSHSVQIGWDAPTMTNFDTYHISVSPINKNFSLDKNLTELRFTIDGLEAGEFYTISMVTVSGGVSSERLAFNVVTSPLAVAGLEATASGNGLTVSWKLNNHTSQSGFVVSYQELPIGVVIPLPPVPVVDGLDLYEANIPDLYPGGEYKVMVQAWQNITGETAGSSVQDVIAITKPRPVQNLTGTLVGTDTIEIEWDRPSDSLVKYYLIEHRAILRDPNTEMVLNSTYSPNITLEDTFPGEEYEVQVYAVKGEVRSDVMKIYVVVAPLAPASVDVLGSKTTSSSVMLQWYYNTTATYVQSWTVSYQDNEGKVQHQTVTRVAGQIIEASVAGLVSGYKYNMSVQSVVKDVMSAPVSVQAVTKPVNMIVLSFMQKPSNSSFIINYDYNNTDHFDSIVFTLLSPRQVITRSKADSPREVEFSPLVSGTLYTVEVHTVSGGEESEMKSIQAQTLPNKPAVMSSATSQEITLSIIRPVGGVEYYHVICYSSTHLIVKDVNITNVQNPTLVSVNMLVPYNLYRCVVSTVLGSYDSSVTLHVSTEQAAPSAVRNLMAIESAPTEVTLSWKVPEQRNGEITVYMIDYTAVDGSDKVDASLNVTYPTVQQEFKNLLAGYQYTFHVRALTITAGTPASVVIHLKTYKPPYKDGVDATMAMPRVIDASLSPADPNKIVVNFTNVFSDKYGKVVQYTVIVTEDKNSQDIINNHILPGWRVARQDSALKAYQVIQNCSTFFYIGSSCDGQFGTRNTRAAGDADYKVFEIGSETGCQDRAYCNGPLKPATTYYVTLRAYTSMQYSDTPFSEAIRTSAIPEEEGSSNLGGILGGVGAAIAIIVVLILVIFIVRRRGQTKSNMYRHQPAEPLANRSSLSNRKSTCPVNLADFKQHIVYMRADSDFKYAEHFEDLKEIGRGQPCTAAEQPCNRGKNRFTNILPYDHSRVKLLPIDDEDGSDYINANYIPGYTSKREYIVSQGPLPATRDDFWRMLWEQNCRNIVMLTKCIEKGREKCDQYWPNGSDAVFYGDLQVATLNETLFPDWTITEFRVSLGEQSRQIRHFHFTSWPDFGVPKKEQVLVRFVRMVREKLIKDAGPIIVHCSAGVGRSGTFVVLDRIIQHIKTRDTVDIYSAVAELRRERVWMVQTEQQYICIHNCLLCILEGREDDHIYDNVGHSNIAFEDDEGVDLN